MSESFQEKIKQNELLEKLARLEHEQWSSWIDYQIRFAPIHGELVAKEYWRKKYELAQVPYEKLTEEQKEHDRVWARKVLAIFAEDQKEHKQKLQQLFDFVLAQDKDWRGSYERLGHGYKTYLAECIGFMDKLKKKFEGLL